jgi:hypothetical protein
MKNSGPYQAFKGSQALKRQAVERVRSKWASRQVFPLSYLKWRTDGGIVSLSGALAETQDPDLFVERTGLPVELGALCEGLIHVGIEFREDKNSPHGLTFDGSATILSFGLEWLDAIEVGEDLRDVVPHFMHVFLSSVLASDFALAAHVEKPVRSSAKRILELWSLELDGRAVAAQEWRAVRADALRASETSTDPWGYPVAELVESLAWPARGLATEFVPILQRFARSWMQFLTCPYLTSEDRDNQHLSMIGMRELDRAQRDAALSKESSETLLDRFPTSKRAILATMQPEAQARMDAAKKKARRETDLVLRGQMDAILGLIHQLNERSSF